MNRGNLRRFVEWLDTLTKGATIKVFTQDKVEVLNEKSPDHVIFFPGPKSIVPIEWLDFVDRPVSKEVAIKIMEKKYDVTL